MNRDEEKLSFADACSQFLTHNRKLIVVLFAFICVVGIGIIAVSSFKEHTAKTASEDMEMLITKWTDLRSENPDDMTAQEDVLLPELEKQALKSGASYAGFRGYTTVGEIYFLRKDWEKALEAYQKAAESLPKNYTAGIAYFNAAVCADELKHYEKALELYTLSSAVKDFALKPRALFNIGRLEEMLDHREKAVEAYTQLAESYPDNNWALYGKSRIIALSINE